MKSTRLTPAGGDPTRIPVSSSSIASAGYLADEQVLEVQFHSGAVYRYFRVPISVYRAFEAAESKGTFFNQTLRDRFEYTRV